MAREAEVAMREHPKSEPLELYHAMLRIRLFEEALYEPILSREVKTPCHLCVGQEAIAVGVCSALRPQDQVFGNHRSHGHYLAKGGDMNKLAAEIWGKETGCSKGRGGSMHIAAPEVGFMGATPIVAGTVSLAVGAALAAKIKREDRIVVSFFGDGAMGEGVVYESLNLVALWELPIIFVCENNGYATHMPLKKHFPTKDLYLAPLDEWCIQIDGNDVKEVYDTTQEAKHHLPAFIEAKTYRLCGHVGPDDNILGTHTDIRPKEEIEEWEKRDPIKTTRHLIYLRDPYDLRSLEDEVATEVNGAIEYARSSPWPKKEDLERWVYA